MFNFVLMKQLKDNAMLCRHNFAFICKYLVTLWKNLDRINILAKMSWSYQNCLSLNANCRHLL